MHDMIRQNVAHAVQNEPVEEYLFEATPQDRSFAELIGLVIKDNFFVCPQAKGEPPPSKENFENVADKASLVKGINDALKYCDDAYNATTDANFNTLITMAGPAKKQA